jgi:benzoate transport
VRPGAARSVADLRELVANSPMSAHQIAAIAVCLGLNMLDGFDVLVMSFTASGVSAEWELSGSQLGLLLSAGLIGMAAGSLLLAPQADRLGRRMIVIISVLVVSVGMLLSGIVHTYLQLCVLRAMTGVGIGGILATATVLVAEYSSNRWRSTASYLYTSGYSIGATVGGAIAAVLIGRYGWRAAFDFGAVVSFAMLPVVYRTLPESVDFLVVRRPIGALRKLNQLLTRMRHATLDALPAIESPGRVAGHGFVRGLFGARLAVSTLLIWTAFFFMMGGYYFVFSWTPKLLASSGVTAQQAITSGVLLSLGGILGTVLFAFIARAIRVDRLVAFCLLVASGLMVVIALTTKNLSVGLWTGIVLGGMSTSAMAGFYALTPRLYAPALRATGMGWGIGVGRLGAILAPLATGMLVDRGWHPVQLYGVFSVSFLIAAAAVSLLPPGRSFSTEVDVRGTERR